MVEFRESRKGAITCCVGGDFPSVPFRPNPNVNFTFALFLPRKRISIEHSSLLPVRLKLTCRTTTDRKCGVDLVSHLLEVALRTLGIDLSPSTIAKGVQEIPKVGMMTEDGGEAVRCLVLGRVSRTNTLLYTQLIKIQAKDRPTTKDPTELLLSRQVAIPNFSPQRSGEWFSASWNCEISRLSDSPPGPGQTSERCTCSSLSSSGQIEATSPASTTL
jgi:hypothetical protein